MHGWLAIEKRENRRRIYALVMLISMVASLAIAEVKAHVRCLPFNLVTSDGRWYYAYLPTLVIDEDLDFSNQLRDHWGPDYRPELLENRNPRGMVDNKYTVGPALTLSPAFLVGHAITSLTNLWPRDGYSFPYQFSCLAELHLISWFTLLLMDRLLVRRLGIDPRRAFLAVLLYWFGSPAIYYTFREPFMAHVPSVFWCTAIVVIVFRLSAQLARRQPDARTLATLGFSAAMAVICRPTNVFLIPFSAALVVAAWRHQSMNKLLAVLPAALVGILPLAVQSTIWHEQSGHWIYYSYGSEGFHWTAPALFSSLWSSRHGLFFWSPVLLLSLIGIVAKLRANWSIWAGCCAMSMLLLWYFNSAWYCWWFGDSFGNRAYVEGGVLFTLGIGWCFQHAGNPGSLRYRAALIFGLAAVAYSSILMALYIARLIPHDGYLY